jgi:peptidoglycan/xylan/chitin deacetylase (PgdA/CDA1 family)
MYHRVTPDRSAKLARWQVTPAIFEEQLKYLRDAGYYSIAWEDWQKAAFAKRPLPGRAIMITFDDGYHDFYLYAWPLLKKYGFRATVFLIAEKVGQSNSWDKDYNEELSLMGWKEIHHLVAEGVEFGSHSATHKPLTALTPAEIVCEAARSRAILERNLGVPVRTFAYPYGDTDAVVQHLIGACGYTFGLTCKPGASKLGDGLLALPRIEVMGSDSLQNFISKV